MRADFTSSIQFHSRRILRCYAALSEQGPRATCCCLRLRNGSLERWIVMRYNIVCGAHNGLELFLIAATILTRDGLAGPTRVLQVVGFSIFAFGLFLLVYSGVHLRRASRGEPDTEGNVLATGGPYRIVRHPYYLGDIIIILGLAVGLRSVWGLIGTVFLLIPSAI